MKVPRSQAKVRSTCPGCIWPIRPGDWTFKDIETGLWLHRQCWTRLIKERDRITPKPVREQ